MKIKKYRVFLGVLLALAILTGICAGVLAWLGGQLQSQKIAESWSGESGQRFAQVSVYFPVNQLGGVDQVRSFRSSLPEKLREVSLESTEDSQMRVDAYSTEAKLDAKTSYGSASAAVYAVGGDYFRFHPLELISGSYFSEADLMEDLVVLDEDMAWRLYGGMDLTGKTVDIAGQQFTVSGVVRRESDFASEKAYPGGGRLYMSYDAYTQLLGGETEPGIRTYEIVLADPISGYAQKLVESAFGSGATQGMDTGGEENQQESPPDGLGAVILQNTGRFSLERIFSVLGDFGERSMNTQGVVYPYWENAARLIEDYMAVVLLLMLLFGVLPALFLIVVAIELLRRGWKKLKAAVPVWMENRRKRRYEARRKA
jgi:hypothetical protein